MAKIRNPIRFSKYFGINETQLGEVGALDSTLNVDTNLFIDPLLFSKSTHPEINNTARKLYVTYFESLIKLLRSCFIKIKEPDF